MVHPLHTVTSVRPRHGGGYVVDTARTGPRMRPATTFTADHVVVAAGTFNTQKLLHRMRDEGILPHISSRLGAVSRTNSESIVGAVSTRNDVDFTKGVAITSSFFPDERTHIEPVRYGKGSNLMGLLGTVMTDGVDGVPRWKVWAKEMAANPRIAARSLSVRKWSEKGAIALVMQSWDNSLTVRGVKSRLGYHLTSKQGDGEPNPTWIPAGNDASRRIAEKIGGFPMGQLGDLIDAPMTAHFVGGACIAADPEHGVIDAYHRVFGHEGLHIVDGAAVSANLGVNPSLTITAQAERAMSFWPNKGDADPRPALGEAQVVLGHRVLRVVPAAGHARAALHAAVALRADAPEVGVLRGDARALAEEHAHRRERERVADPHVLGDLGEDVVERGAPRHPVDAEHPRGLVVVRGELGLPVGDARPLRVLEELLRRDVERVRVDQRAAADPGAAQHHGVGQQVDALDAVEPEAGRVEEATHAPRGLGEVVVVEAAAGLEDADPVALLGEPERRDRPAEPGADDDDVVVHGLGHRAPPWVAGWPQRTRAGYPRVASLARRPGVRTPRAVDA